MAAEKHAKGLRIVIFGKSQAAVTTLSTCITGKKLLSGQDVSKISTAKTEWRTIPLTVVTCPEAFSLPPVRLTNEVRQCLTHCPPGPNALLLVVNPLDFTEDDGQRFKFIVSILGTDAYEYSMVVTTQENSGSNLAVVELVKDCKQRQYTLSFSQSDFPDGEDEALMEKMIRMVNENGGLICTKGRPSVRTPSLESNLPLNLVLCGRFDVGKTSAASAILGEQRCLPPASSSECVRNQVEVCGRRVSLVELPSLYEKPSEVSRQQIFGSVSLCDPEGVHAFILVLPLDPPSNEDRKELETIENILSPQGDHFIMILLTVESDPEQQDVVEFVKNNQQIQALCRRYDGRYLVFNIHSQEQIPRLVDIVEKMKAGTSKGFTKEMMPQPRLVEPQCSLNRLRVVLIGKTGCGKSATANTLLGEAFFDSKSCAQSVTKVCKKQECEVDGRPVAVVDTPGLFDTSLTNDEVKRELVKCISLLAPGPHVFLLVVQIGRFTEEERETVQLIKNFFGQGAENFIIIIFTRGDDLTNQTLEEFIESHPEGALKKLTSECGGRYHAFNNREKTNRSQVSQLLHKVDLMVQKNNGAHYTSKMFQEAENAIQKEMQRIMEENEEEVEKQRRSLERKYEEQLHENQQRLEFERAEREKALREKEKYVCRAEDEGRKRKQMREIENLKLVQTERQPDSRERLAQMISDNKKATPKKPEEGQASVMESKERKEKKIQVNLQKQEEERIRLKKLREEYQKAIKEEENKRAEEDRMKMEQEATLKKMYEDKVKILVMKNEEAARTKAQELNEFRRKYSADVRPLIKGHEQEVEDMKQHQRLKQDFIISQLNSNKANKRDYDKMKKAQQDAMSELMKYLPRPQQIQELEKKHQKEVDEWIQQRIKGIDKNKSCHML